jgi:hypothetical protein
LLKTTETLRIGGAPSRQNLDGNFPSEPQIARAVNFTHSARPEWGNDLVRPEFCAGAKCHSPAIIVLPKVSECLLNPRHCASFPLPLVTL